MTIKVLGLDLDGTVRETMSGQTFINNPLDQCLMEGVEDAIARYPDWRIVGITNQGGVKAGFKSLEDCVAEQKRTMELIPRMELLLFCVNDGESFYRLRRRLDGQIPSHPTERRINAFEERWPNFRKPNPGMLLFAYYYFANKGADEFLYVGDRTEDRDAAKNAGLPFLWAQDWRSKDPSHWIIQIPHDPRPVFNWQPKPEA
jgi:D-glycero-D-manno-heptose 1,7-bisphosphate phosphatase